MAANFDIAGLLASTLSSSLGTTVVTYEEYKREKEKSGAESYQALSIDQIFGISRRCGEVGQKEISREETASTTGVRFSLFVKTISGKDIVIWTTRDEYVSDIKAKVQERTGIPAADQRLSQFCGRDLKDSKQLCEYDNIQPNTTLILLLRPPDGRSAASDRDFDHPTLPNFYLDDSTLDPPFNYDFSRERDDGKEYYRGGKRYYRPYGWCRLALKVRGIYDDDTWLGENSIRTYSCPGEWPVCYRGTGLNNCKNIAQEGYDLSKGRRFAHGVGIYCTPSIDVAAGFASIGTYEGQQYQVVFQNRVSTQGLKEISTSNGEYWVQPRPELIRPYGICVRPIPFPKQEESSCTLL